MKKIYRFSQSTGEFIAERDAIENPREPGEFLLPSNSTFKTPPKKKKGKAIVRKDNKWISVDDLRGKVFYGEGQETYTVSSLNFVLGSDQTFEKPPSKDHELVNGIWTNPLKFYNIKVETAKDVKRLTKVLIREGGEDEAKTEKLLTPKGKICQVWEEWLVIRGNLRTESKKFIKDNNLK